MALLHHRVCGFHWRPSGQLLVSACYFANYAMQYHSNSKIPSNIDNFKFLIKLKFNNLMSYSYDFDTVNSGSAPKCGCEGSPVVWSVVFTPVVPPTGVCCSPPPPRQSRSQSYFYFKLTRIHLQHILAGASGLATPGSKLQFY